MAVGLCLLLLGAADPLAVTAATRGDPYDAVPVWLDKRHPIIRLALTAMSARGYDTAPFGLVMFRKTEEHYSLTFFPSPARRAKPAQLLVVVVEGRGGKVISIDEAPGLR